LYGLLMQCNARKRYLMLIVCALLYAMTIYKIKVLFRVAS
jgi:hypothetical protein